MAGLTWRRRAREVVARIEATWPDASADELRVRLSNGYPWGERYGYPYRVWLEEARQAVVKRAVALGTYQWRGPKQAPELGGIFGEAEP